MESSKNASLSRSIYLMSVTLPPNALFIPLGALAALLNVFTLAIICSSKSLRTKCFVLLASNAISDFLLGVGYMSTGAVRVYRHYAGQGELTSMWRCCLEVTVIIFAQVLSLGNAAALVIDRLLAIVCPHRYKHWSFRQLTVPSIISVYIFALIQLGVHYQNSWVGRNIILNSCGIEDTVFAKTLSVMTVFQMTLSIAIVALNCVIVCVIRKNKKQIQAGASRQNESPHEGEKKIIRAITFILVSHLFTHLGGRLAIFLVSLYADDQAQAMTNRYGREVVVLNAALHFFVLYTISSQFRAATKVFFGAAPVTAVHPAQVQSISEQNGTGKTAGTKLVKLKDCKEKAAN